MNAEELRSLRSYPRYFQVDGIPVRVMSKSHLPESYAGHGRWEPYPAQARLLVYGRFVTPKRFDALCRAYDQHMEHGGPFLDVD